MSKQIYYSSKKLLKQAGDSNYFIILGERSNGKSYDIKHLCLKEAIKNPYDKKFMLLRRWDIDIKQKQIEQYFMDANISELTNGDSDGIVAYQGKIFLGKYNDDEQKMKKSLHIGYYCALNMDEHYKSGIYTDVSNIIYEEFISNNMYLPKEPTRLQNFVSTVARRNKIRVWLIGNTISRVCPYFYEWELRGIPRQKQGTIDIYEHKTDQLTDDGEQVVIKIAVEYAENNSKNSKMFFGTAAKQITGGLWQTEEKPHLPDKREQYSLMHTIILEWAGFKFKCEFLLDEKSGAVMWYVTPKTTKIKEGERVITDRVVPDPMYTRGLIPLAPAEQVAFSYLRQGEIYFSDNLTGSDFEICLKKVLTNN